jgi:hypothetical protein
MSPLTPHGMNKAFQHFHIEYLINSVPFGYTFRAGGRARHLILIMFSAGISAGSIDQLVSVTETEFVNVVRMDFRYQMVK